MPRLPISGGDAGAWGNILNDFLSVSHDTTDGTLAANTVGDTQVNSISQSKVSGLSAALSAKATDSTVVHLAGTESVTGDKNFTGFLQHNGNAVVDTTDIRLMNQDGHYPVSAYGCFSMTASAENISEANITSASLFLTRMYVPAGKPIARVAACLFSAGTLAGGGVNGFAIYDSSGTLVDSTPSDNNLWTATSWRSKAFTTPIAAQSTGRFVYAAIIVNGYSGDPHLLYNVTIGNTIVGDVGGGTFMHNIYASGQTSLPASFNPTSFGGLLNYMPLLGLASS